MDNTNLSLEDVSNIISYIKLHISKYGSDSPITITELENLENTKRQSFNKFKNKFGKDYLDQLNIIMNSYVNFKGGATRYPTSYRVQQRPTSGYSTGLSAAAPSFLAGLVGQQTYDAYGQPTASNLIGQYFAPAAQQALTKITGVPQYPPLQLQQQPIYQQQQPQMMQPVYQQLQQPVYQQQLQPQPQPQLQLQPVYQQQQLQDTDELINEACNKCNAARQQRGGNSDLNGDIFIEHTIPINIHSDSEQYIETKKKNKRFNLSKEQIMLHNSLYTIDQLG